MIPYLDILDNGNTVEMGEADESWLLYQRPRCPLIFSVVFLWSCFVCVPLSRPAFALAIFSSLKSAPLTLRDYYYREALDLFGTMTIILCRL